MLLRHAGSLGLLYVPMLRMRRLHMMLRMRLHHVGGHRHGHGEGGGRHLEVSLMLEIKGGYAQTSIRR